jgi:hypothetical protein
VIEFNASLQKFSLSLVIIEVFVHFCVYIEIIRQRLKEQGAFSSFTRKLENMSLPSMAFRMEKRRSLLSLVTFPLPLPLLKDGFRLGESSLKELSRLSSDACSRRSLSGVAAVGAEETEATSLFVSSVVFGK